VLLTGIRWPTYAALLEDLGDRPIRLTYDRGSLEIMAPSFRPEGTAKWIGQLVEALAEELNVPYLSAGSTTFRREDLDRGLEPDECFYIANVDRVRGREDLDLTTDPPPDLVVEVDVTSSSIDRLGIYAAMEVPEVWRWRGAALVAYRLRPERTYESAAASLAFPTLPLDGLTGFIQQGIAQDQLSLKRAFRAWVATWAATQ
jgi:Uma2 family endonuclease